MTEFAKTERSGNCIIKLNRVPSVQNIKLSKVWIHCVKVIASILAHARDITSKVDTIDLMCKE